MMRIAFIYITVLQSPLIVCPITKQLMKDPVMAEDGITYDRAAITEWYASTHGKNEWCAEWYHDDLQAGEKSDFTNHERAHWQQLETQHYGGTITAIHQMIVQ